MYRSKQSGVRAYAKIGLEIGAAVASPHQLIVMLFDGALLAVATALQCMNTGDIANKGKSVSFAISIIDNGLRASLDKDAGGDIAKNLDALYDYMTRRLLMANIKNQPEGLQEVHRLLNELKEAWQAIEAPESVAMASA